MERLPYCNINAHSITISLHHTHESETISIRSFEIWSESYIVMSLGATILKSKWIAHVLVHVHKSSSNATIRIQFGNIGKSHGLQLPTQGFKAVSILGYIGPVKAIDAVRSEHAVLEEWLAGLVDHWLLLLHLQPHFIKSTLFTVSIICYFPCKVLHWCYNYNWLFWLWMDMICLP